ncbi:MAG TPA: hypothetical protein VJB06_01265, partial [archaeon]|nr:hypothetical protein [archaeon]
KNKELKYKFRVTSKGISVGDESVVWNDIKSILGQVGRTDKKIGYKKKHHNVVIIERKSSFPIKFVAEEEMFGGFDYTKFIAALAALNKEKMLKPVGEKDKEVIEKKIKYIRKG